MIYQNIIDFAAVTIDSVHIIDVNTYQHKRESVLFKQNFRFAKMKLSQMKMHRLKIGRKQKFSAQVNTHSDLENVLWHQSDDTYKW